MIKCVIVDDEPLAVKLLAAYVEKIDNLELLASFTNPLKALTFFQSQEVDLIFLDIQMPELSGIQFAKIIGEKTSIIFTTAYPNFAVEGFELEAIDYLVKPITLERFIKATSRVSTKVTTASNPMTVPSPASQSNYIFVKTEYRHQKILLDDILYFQGYGDYVAIHKKGEKILTLQNMKFFESELAGKQFIRVHKSYIVAIDKIDFVEKNRVVIEKEYIPISATYVNEFKSRVLK